MKTAKSPTKQKSKRFHFFHNRRAIIISIAAVLLFAGASWAVVLSQKGNVAPEAYEQQPSSAPVTSDQKTETSKTPQDAPSTPKPQTSEHTLSMKLSGQPTVDNKFMLSWKISGLPKKSYTTLLFSRDTANPTVYDVSNGEKATSFVNINNKQSLTWNYPDGKTVWFRLCAYSLEEAGGTDKLSCNVGVSNVVSYTAPYVATEIIQPGAIQLATQGTVLSWSYNGTAPFGFIVVGFSFIDFTRSTAATSMDVSDTPDSYDYFYVCKKGYYEQVDCSKGVSVAR